MEFNIRDFLPDYVRAAIRRLEAQQARLFARADNHAAQGWHELADLNTAHAMSIDTDIHALIAEHSILV